MMRSTRPSFAACAVIVVVLAACQDKAAGPNPGDKPAEGSNKGAEPVASKGAESAPSKGAEPAEPAAATASDEDFSGTLYNLGMWSEMHAYCGWKAEPFTDLKTRLAAAPKLVAAKVDVGERFDAGVTYGAKEAKKRADQRAKGETPSAWACAADVEASVLEEIDRLLAAE